MKNEDDSHLDGLAIGHYVVGGIAAFFACMPLIHMGIGIAVLSGIEMADDTGQPAPMWFGWLFFLIGLFAFLFGQAISVAIIFSGRFLKRRKHYMFSFVIACIACAFMPFGTVLGVLTIIVLSRKSVKSLYGLS
ncbi:MAG: hypothetical protein AAF065_00455 [Verrucomicrobiota bacterium]